MCSLSIPPSVQLGRLTHVLCSLSLLHGSLFQPLHPACLNSCIICGLAHPPPPYPCISLIRQLGISWKSYGRVLTMDGVFKRMIAYPDPYTITHNASMHTSPAILCHRLPSPLPALHSSTTIFLRPWVLRAEVAEHLPRVWTKAYQCCFQLATDPLWH
jgi:hypothetical protein